MGDSVLNYAFLPIFVDYKKNKSEEEAWVIANSVFTITNLCLVFISVQIFIFAPYVVTLLVPGFSQEASELTTLILRVISFVPLLAGLSAFISVIFFSYKSFTTPALTFLLYGSTTIIVTLLLADRFGIVSVAIGANIGIGLHVLLLFYFLKKNGKTFKLSWNLSHPGVRKAGKLMGPRFISVLLSRVNFLIDIFFVSTLGVGFVSYLTYAYRLIQLPFTMLVGVLGRTLMPMLSEHGASGSHDKIREFVSKSIRTVSFVILPLTMILFVFRVPIVGFFFQRGPFDTEDTYFTSVAFMFYDIGLISFSLSAILQGVFHALQDSVTPLKIGIFSFIVNIALDLLFIKWLGLGGIALATSIVSIMSVTFLLIFLRRKIGRLGGYKIAVSCTRIFLASAIMGVAIYLISNNISVQMFFNSQIFKAAFLTVISFALYLSACALLRVDELQKIMGFVRRKLKV